MKEETNGGFVLPLDSFPTRNSSMGRSSRSYYYRRTSEGVPFQWEMLPGTPKNTPPLVEPVPLRICPPPVVVSLSLLKPATVQNKQPQFLLFRLWRKQSKSNNNYCPLDDHRSKFGSPCKAKSRTPAAESPGHWRFGCSPWRINPIKIATGRRV